MDAAGPGMPDGDPGVSVLATPNRVVKASKPPAMVRAQVSSGSLPEARQRKTSGTSSDQGPCELTGRCHVGRVCIHDVIRTRTSPTARNRESGPTKRFRIASPRPDPVTSPSLAAISFSYRVALRQFERAEIPPAPIRCTLVDWSQPD